MSFAVTANISSKKKRVTSKRFRTRAEAEAFARATKKFRRGSNPRIVRKSD